MWNCPVHCGNMEQEKKIFFDEKTRDIWPIAVLSLKSQMHRRKCVKTILAILRGSQCHRELGGVLVREKLVDVKNSDTFQKP